MSALRQVSSMMLLRGAYGRDYDNAATLLADWDAGKDFRIVGGPYCSIRDLPRLRDDASSVWLIALNGKVSVKVG